MTLWYVTNQIIKERCKAKLLLYLFIKYCLIKIVMWLVSIKSCEPKITYPKNGRTKTFQQHKKTTIAAEILEMVLITWTILCSACFWVFVPHAECSCSWYPSDMSNLIFRCGTLITANQKQTSLCCIRVYKVQNMSCQKEDIIANGRNFLPKHKNSF